MTTEKNKMKGYYCVSLKIKSGPRRAFGHHEAARQDTAMWRPARPRWRHSRSHGDGGEKGYSGN
jgi:hypothetical protein